jgi:hypothetical protein
MTLVITAATAWVLLALPVGVLLGRGVRMADEHAEAPFSTAGVENYLREQASAPLS